MTKLSELADRVSALEGPCTATDREIAMSLPRGDWWDDCMGEPGYEAKRFTESLDAAMSLVPEGWGIKLEHNMGYGASCTVGHVGANKFYDRPEGWAKAATPALALTAASLRARDGGEG